MHVCLLAILLLFSTLTARAEEGGTRFESCAPERNLPDSTATESYRFHPAQLILPSALIAIGSFGVSNNWVCEMKHDMDRALTATRGSHRFHADNYLQFIPMAAYLSMGAIGLPSRHSIKERLLAGATATVVTLAITEPLKHWVKEERPDKSDRYSFPSGHTAISFMGAELIRLEYDNDTASFCAYVVAAGTWLLRLYNRRHWINDLLAGAGVGIFSARIAYWLLPVYDRLFSKHDSKKAIALMPGYSPEARGISLNAAIIF